MVEIIEDKDGFMITVDETVDFWFTTEEIKELYKLLKEHFND